MSVVIDTSTFDEDKIGTRWYAFLILHYLVISLLLIHFYQHQIDADGIIYISLAQKYLAGNYIEAITGHWAPLISLVMVPFLSFGFEPILAFRIVSLIIGLICLAGISILLQQLKIIKRSRIFYLLSLSLIIAWHAENDVGADLLGATILIYYIYFLLRMDYQANKFAGFTSGLLGALAYLAKSYNFYFFILHFSITNFCYRWFASNRQQKKTITTNFYIGVFAFAIVSGIWIGLISNKYHKLTVSNAGSYNLSSIQPGSHDQPLQTDGFFNPPNATAVSAWEDPSLLKLTPWNPLKSSQDFRYYLKKCFHNISKYVSGLSQNYILDLTVLFFSYLLVFKRDQINCKIYYIIFTILLYPIGYFALYYDGQRYVLINVFLLYALSASALNPAFVKYKEVKIMTICISLLLYTSLFALTSYRVYRDYNSHIFLQNSIYSRSIEVSRYFDMKNKNIASQNGSWNRAFDLTFFLKARYFGRAKDNISDNVLRKELLERHINYYFVYGDLNHNVDILKPGQSFKIGPEKLTIYTVHPEV